MVSYRIYSALSTVLPFLSSVLASISARATLYVGGLIPGYMSIGNYADDEIAKVGRNVLCFEITPEHMTGKLVNEA